MKTISSLVFAGLLFASFPFSVTAVGVSAFPEYPMLLYGTAQVNGSLAPVGSVITAYCGSVPLHSVSIVENGVYGYEQPTKQQLVVGPCTVPLSFSFVHPSVNGGRAIVDSVHTSISYAAGLSQKTDLQFTYSVSISGGGGGGGGGGGTSSTQPSSMTQPVIPLGEVLSAQMLPVSQTIPPIVVKKIATQMGLGSTGEDVKTLQSFLFEKGYLKVAPTGYFGLLTKSAVETYQAARALPPVGNVGPRTLEKINAEISSPAVPQSTPSQAALIAQLEAQIKILTEQLRVLLLQKVR